MTKFNLPTEFQVFLFGLILTANAMATSAATHGMVASVNSQATDAGLNVLKQGGNAVDGRGCGFDPWHCRSA